MTSLTSFRESRENLGGSEDNRDDNIRTSELKFEDYRTAVMESPGSQDA